MDKHPDVADAGPRGVGSTLELAALQHALGSHDGAVLGVARLELEQALVRGQVGRLDVVGHFRVIRVECLPQLGQPGGDLTQSIIFKKTDRSKQGQWAQCPKVEFEFPIDAQTSTSYDWVTA